MVKENPVFTLFALLLLFTLVYGYFMDSRITSLQIQVQKIERIQRGD